MCWPGLAEVEDPVEAVARLGARLILQQALEDEVTDFVGRARYERVDGGEEVIYRNGFQEPSTVRTTSGPTVIERPRVRDATRVGFESEVLGKGVARTHALEALIVCSFLRGLSVRDVEAALEECFGEQVIGKSTVARVCKDTAVRYAAWCERDLSEHDLVYLYLDAIYLKLRPDDEPVEGVLVAWGSPWRAARCCSGCRSDRARATTAGSTSAATSKLAGCDPQRCRRRWSPRDLEGHT